MDPMDLDLVDTGGTGAESDVGWRVASGEAVGSIDSSRSSHKCIVYTHMTRSTRLDRGDTAPGTHIQAMYKQSARLTYWIVYKR